MRTLLSVVNRGLEWWLGEVRALGNTRLLSRLIPGPGLLRLRWGRDALVVCHVHRGRERDVHRGPLSDASRMPDLRQAAKAAGAGEKAAAYAIVLRIDACHALRRVLELPAEAATNLQQTLSWDIDRLTPFAADAVHFGWRMAEEAGSRPASRKVRIEFAFVPRAFVDHVLAELGGGGTQVDTIEVAWEARGDSPAWPVRLAASELTAERKTRVGRRAAVALACMAGLLGLAVASAPFYRQHLELRALDEQIARLKPQAAAAQEMRRELTELDAGARIILNARSGRPQALQVLEEVTRLTPDGTWLDMLRFAQTEVQAAGHSDAASSLISTFETSPMFEQTRFVAPVTRDLVQDAESFRIVFRVVPGEQP